MSKKLTVGQRVHFVDDNSDTGKVVSVHSQREGTLYTVLWDDEASASLSRYRPDELVAIEPAQVWVITRGSYDAMRIVAVASSEAEARRIVGEHQEAHRESGDCFGRFETWGPFKLNEMNLGG